MSRKMLINASDPEEIRVALVEGSILEEYYVERLSVESCLGNIYKGRVTNVEPSIGAAFVEFGNVLTQGAVGGDDALQFIDEVPMRL